MKNIEVSTNGKFIFKKGNITIKTMFEMGKIWLTKKEIANLFGVKKSEIKKEINDLIFNSKINFKNYIIEIYDNTKNKTKTYYSLDILLLLGYKGKHYKETKFLISTNNTLKEYTKNRQYRSQNIGNVNGLIKKLIKYFIK